MPRFAEMSGWWQGDARAVVPSGKCRHGFDGEEGYICKQSLLKGALFWLKPVPPPGKLPPPFKLPYLGGWTKADGKAAWARFHALGMRPLEPLDFLEAHKERSSIARRSPSCERESVSLPTTSEQSKQREAA